MFAAYPLTANPRINCATSPLSLTNIACRPWWFPDRFRPAL